MVLMLRCPVTGIEFEPVTWGALLAGFGGSVPHPEQVVRVEDLHPQAEVEFVPVHDAIPEAVWGRLVPLFTRVRLQVAHGPGGTWKSFFPPVVDVGQPGGWLVVSDGSWRFYVE